MRHKKVNLQLRFSYSSRMLIDISISYRCTKIYRSCRIQNLKQEDTQMLVQTYTHTHSSKRSHIKRGSRRDADKNFVNRYFDELSIHENTSLLPNT